MNSSALARHDIQIIKEFEEVPPITVDKHKVLQILVNLVTNAKQACDNSRRPEKTLFLRVSTGNDHVRIAVSDNGVGIPSENLTRIFGHGFTTKKDGHGFGLHSGALAAKEMGGALHVHSDGVGQGATFTLELPLNQAGGNISDASGTHHFAN
jgi:signal transduction histidine kinase